MKLMMEHDSPGDYVVATGETHSVGDFVKAAFREIGIDNWEDYIVVDPKFYRPAEVDYLLGDSTKAFNELGWIPRITFEELVTEMVNHDKV